MSVLWVLESAVGSVVDTRRRADVCAVDAEVRGGGVVCQCCECYRESRRSDRGAVCQRRERERETMLYLNA